jgi:transcriptional regulator with XRE-family HTH domain
MRHTPLGAKIRELRKSRRLSQEQLAAAAGLGIATIDRIERGVQYPSDETVAKLEAALSQEPRALQSLGRIMPKSHARATGKIVLKEEVSALSLERLKERAATLGDWPDGVLYKQLLAKWNAQSRDVGTPMFAAFGAFCYRLGQSELLAEEES